MVRRTVIVAVPVVLLGLAGSVFFLTQGIVMSDTGLIVAAALLLFSVAVLALNAIVLVVLRRGL